MNDRADSTAGAWPISRVDRVASVNARIGWKALTAAEYESDGYAFLATPNIKGNEIDFENVNFISEYRYQESPELKLAVGDVLLAKDGSTLGITNVVQQLPRPATVNGSIAVLRPLRIEPRFLRYSLAGEAMQSLIAQVKDGMGVPHLFQRDINRLPILLPSIETQARIANFLDDQVDRIDRSIVMRRHQIDTLRVAITSLAYESVTGGNHERRRRVHLFWAASLPAHWSVGRLASIAKMGSGHTPSRSDADYWLDCDIPWLTTGDVHRLRDDEVESLDQTAVQISELGLRNSSAVVHPTGSVALSRTASAGFSVILGAPMATSQDFVVWRPSPHISPDYLLWCLRAMRPDLLGRLAMGSTHKTIYFPDLESLRVPLPPPQDQLTAVQAIRRRSPEIFALMAAVRDSLSILEERKRALITAAVMGEFDVSSASTRASNAVV